MNRTVQISSFWSVAVRIRGNQLVRFGEKNEKIRLNRTYVLDNISVNNTKLNQHHPYCGIVESTSVVGDVISSSLTHVYDRTRFLQVVALADICMM